MLPTFVNKRVTGAERGDYYALDLGGTNFRVLRLTLEGGGVVGPVKSMKFAIPDAAKTGTGAELFGFLADSVARFIALECGGDVNIGREGFCRFSSASAEHLFRLFQIVDTDLIVYQVRCAPQSVWWFASNQAD